MSLLLTLAVAYLGVLLASKLKWPAAPMLGALLTVSIFNMMTNSAHIPLEFKIMTQMIAGIFIGMRINKSDIKQLRSMLGPVAIVLSLLMMSCLIMGYGIHFIANISTQTGLLATAPGGLVDMTLMSDDLGADSATVSVFQIARLLTVISIFPLLFPKLLKRFKIEQTQQQTSYNQTNDTAKGKKEMIITLVVAVSGGLIGKFSGIPAGTLIFSMIGCSIQNILFDNTYMPKPVRSAAQMCAGALIGCNVTMIALLELKSCLIPAIIMIIGYFIINIALAYILHRLGNIDFITAFFACAPGGASDMTLMSADFGANMAQVSVVQILRSIGIIAFYPVIITILTT